MTRDETILKAVATVEARMADQVAEAIADGRAKGVPEVEIAAYARWADEQIGATAYRLACEVDDAVDELERDYAALPLTRRLWNATKHFAARVTLIR